MSRVVFVTGTDTGVGKTVVTAALAAAYSASGLRVAALKIAQTGLAPDEPGDMDEVARLARVETRELVRLGEALAPDTAARLAGVTLPDLCGCRDAVHSLAERHDVVLVEGAGGIMVNLGDAFTLLDVATMVTLEKLFVVVARPGLGTLNHSALTVWAIQERGLYVEGLVLGSWPSRPGLAETQNQLDLPAQTGVPVLGAVPEGAPGEDDFHTRASAWFSYLP